MPTNDQELSELSQAVQEAYERAAADGLCEIGALEIAREVLRVAIAGAGNKAYSG
jgi:L-aminopeptidase/D-esterase-like protein